MSMESAAKALEAPVNAPNIDANAPRIDSKPPVEGSATPKTLEEAVKPIPPEKPAIGADRFAALARQERQNRKLLSEIKAREAKLSEWEKTRTEVAANPLKALEVLGISYQQLTDFILNGQKPTADLEVKAVRDEVAKLKQEQAERDAKAKQAAKDRAEREYQSTLAEFKEEVNEYLSTNKDAYELTNMYEGNDIVTATIEQHFNNTKKIMSIKEAADLVEQYFEEQVKRANSAKKFQSPKDSKKDGQSQSAAAAKTSAPTLNNGMTSSAPSLLPAKTENDRIQRALAALGK